MDYTPLFTTKNQQVMGPVMGRIAPFVVVV